MEDALADAHGRHVEHAGGGAAAVASSRRRRIEPSRAPFSTATGCISQAAAASITVSGSPRSRPPANAWRNAASENATARPICFA